MAKLTLSIDASVIARAKSYAEKRGISVSGMVGSYLAAVSEGPSEGKRDTPILRAVTGCLKKGSVEDYRKHLEAKYL